MTEAKLVISKKMIDKGLMEAAREKAPWLLLLATAQTAKEVQTLKRIVKLSRICLLSSA